MLTLFAVKRFARNARMMPTRPARSVGFRVDKTGPAIGFATGGNVFRVPRYPWSRFLSATMAVLLLASALSAVSVVFTHARARAVSYQDWPMFLQNPARTGATVDPKLSVSSAATLKLKFAFATGGPIATSVSIVG